jgi:hypothetical protein
MMAMATTTMKATKGVNPMQTTRPFLPIAREADPTLLNLPSEKSEKIRSKYHLPW